MVAEGEARMDYELLLQMLEPVTNVAALQHTLYHLLRDTSSECKEQVEVAVSEIDELVQLLGMFFAFGVYFIVHI